MIRAGLLAIFFLPSLTMAAETCPFVNTATAEGVLGIALESKVTHSSVSTKCVFSGNGKSAGVFLEIEVVTGAQPSAPRCSSPALALKTIGNEALTCSVGSAGDQVAEAVFGRVRDQHFRIAVTTEDQHISRDKLREEARVVALHVAGSLF